MDDPWASRTPQTGRPADVRRLRKRFSSALFSRGILVCPESEGGSYRTSVPSDRLPRTVTRVGDAGLFYLSGDPDLRRFHTCLTVGRVQTSHPGPGPRWDDTWTLETADALAVFDFKGRCYGYVTEVAGTYLLRSRIIDATESPGDEFYIPPGWFLEVTMLDPASGQPVDERWWDRPTDLQVPLGSTD